MGVGIGITFGLALNNLGVGLSIGIGGGMFWGMLLNKEKKKCEDKKQVINEK